MKLTESNKKYIDSLSMEQLLSAIRFARAGDPYFQGETGEYWLKHYSELRAADPAKHVAASKRLGW